MYFYCFNDWDQFGWWLSSDFPNVYGRKRSGFT